MPALICVPDRTLRSGRRRLGRAAFGAPHWPQWCAGAALQFTSGAARVWTFGQARRAVDLPDVTACGLLLVDHDGTLNMVAASTEQAWLPELFQRQNAECPCLDCFHSGQPVRVPT
ncbi:MAG TPA: hypothetical protein VLW50_08670 [Streptosporangiaceae bacterium]|nr:hypothetical protein [Streptosporangiaceae bacterium]